jgi:hypothetical protein
MPLGGSVCTRQSGQAGGADQLRDRLVCPRGIVQRRLLAPLAERRQQLRVVRALVAAVVALTAHVLHAEQAQRSRGGTQFAGLAANWRS